MSEPSANKDNAKISENQAAATKKPLKPEPSSVAPPETSMAAEPDESTEPQIKPSVPDAKVQVNPASSPENTSKPVQSDEAAPPKTETSENIIEPSINAASEANQSEEVKESMASEAVSEPKPSAKPLATEEIEPKSTGSISKTKDSVEKKVAPDVGVPPEKPPAQPQVIEKIIIKEVPRTPTAADKEKIFQEKSKEQLTKANQKKLANYEKHLQEIVDFIKARGTLVTNHDIEEGLGMPDDTITYRLNELIKRGIIKRLGSGFKTKYKLIQGL